MSCNQEDTIIIEANNSLLDVNLKELWKYRDLVLLFVKRNYTTRYKQTILGPAWLVITPLLSTILYSIIFTGVARLPTDGVHALAFYMTGNILWSCFSSCLQQTSGTFLNNAGIMGKVYFPRLVMPISTIITAMADFAIQLCLLVCLLIILALRGNTINISLSIFFIPFVVLQIALLGFGVGIIVSSLTTKYRDLNVLVGFGVQLWMYASPVVYSVSLIPQKYQLIYLLNPVTPCLIVFRHAFLGIGEIPYKAWGISWVFTILILVAGVIIFNKVEKTFMDTV